MLSGPFRQPCKRLTVRVNESRLLLPKQLLPVPSGLFQIGYVPDPRPVGGWLCLLAGTGLCLEAKPVPALSFLLGVRPLSAASDPTMTTGLRLCARDRCGR